MTPHREPHPRSRPWLACLLLAGLLFACGTAWADDAASDAGGWYVSPQIKRLTNSHTSYEFGDPTQRELSPLSRLEFPLNSWWGGLGLGYKGPRYTLGLTLLTSLPDQDDIGVMRDSDWEDPARSKLKTTYSESTVKLKNSLDLDGKLSVSVARELGLPAWLDLRPLMGVRWQRFVFLAHDGVQQNMESNGQWSFYPLEGDGIWFRQQYLHAYAGVALSADLGGLGLGAMGQGWKLEMQADVAHVYGENYDRHLLRGDRYTTERTQGYGLHGSLGLRAPVFSWGSLVLSGDYLVIETRGEHYWKEAAVHAEENWDYGVRVWSRQASLSLALEVPF